MRALRQSMSAHADTSFRASPSQVPDAAPLGDLVLQGYNDMPAWFQYNKFILTGYRPICGSISSCCRSLTYMHNESINIYSHLLPGVALLIILLLGDEQLLRVYPEVSTADRAVFIFELLAAVACMLLSSIYHTLMNHSARYSDLWGRIDYCGIMLLIFGDFVSGIYFGLYCEPGLQKIYWLMITVCTFVTANIVLRPEYQSRRHRVLRLVSFTATGFSAFAPIFHAMQLFPYAQLNRQSGLNYYLLEGGIVLIAAAIYGTMFPESKWPGRFDNIGHSHQIFHVLTVIATLVHLSGSKSAFDYNYTTRRCHAISP